MTSQITFYLSQILGNAYISDDGTVLGKIKDFLIDQSSLPGNEAEPVRPRVVANSLKPRPLPKLRFPNIQVELIPATSTKKLSRKIRKNTNRVLALFNDLWNSKMAIKLIRRANGIRRIKNFSVWSICSPATPII